MYFNGGVPLSQLQWYYEEWVKDDLYTVMEKEVEGKKSYYGFLMSKRGNRAYQARVRKRFKPYWEVCRQGRGIEFFGKRTNDLGRFAWITLTYNPSRCGLNEAWLTVGKDLNKYMSYLRKVFGKVSYIRCFEAYTKRKKDGKYGEAYLYPHLHLLVYFHERQLPCFKTKKGGYLFSNYFMEKLHKGWHSNVKCEPAKGFGSIGYILKYITKEIHQQDSLETMFMTWLFGKRCFGVSKEFLAVISAYLNAPTRPLLHNSNRNQAKDSEKVESWSFTGLTMRALVRFDAIWVEIPYDGASFGCLEWFCEQYFGGLI